jgi:hypothetical protein
MAKDKTGIEWHMIALAVSWGAKAVQAYERGNGHAGKPVGGRQSNPTGSISPHPVAKLQ